MALRDLRAAEPRPSRGMEVSNRLEFLERLYREVAALLAPPSRDSGSRGYASSTSEQC
jgi:hypothetical protein